MEPSIKDIQEILKVFLDSELQDLRLEVGTVRLAVSKGGGTAMQPFASAPAPAPAPVARAAAPVAAAAPAPQAASPAASPAAAPRAGLVAVTAPSVGTFYRCPAPHQPPYVQPGAAVAEGDTLCLIEVMKMFTGVTAPCKGKVVEILVEDATLVEHGQVLMYVEPA